MVLKIMIRTAVVKTTIIPAMAYKQKLQAGGTGITIITPDDRATFTINKRDGSCVPYGKVNASVFTDDVISEVLELTSGLPYRRLGKVTKVHVNAPCEEAPVEQEVDDEEFDINIISSREYAAFIEMFSDKNGKFSHQLMNKTLIQFAAKSGVVSKKLTEKENIDFIVRYVVRSKAALLARNKGMDDEMLTAFIETIDSICTRSAFKELNAYLRGRLSRKKK
ncbi:MAG: hypothetical protein LBD23_04245 [Oscillospiraceae bacterium]|jgi:hypothetical protein|nr:hypothetical protein [Oscillospiraceae bacterium]